MFVCLFIYSFVFCFNHHRIPKGSFPQNFMKIGLDLAEILRIRKLDWKCLFVFLFVCLFIDLFIFCFNHHIIPKGSYPENFVKIRLSLSGKLRIWKNCLFLCLFVCLFIYLCVFVLIIVGHPKEVSLKILWRLDLIWLRYLESKRMFISLLFLYGVVCFWFWSS